MVHKYRTSYELCVNQRAVRKISELVLASSAERSEARPARRAARVYPNTEAVNETMSSCTIVREMTGTSSTNRCTRTHNERILRTHITSLCPLSLTSG